MAKSGTSSEQKKKIILAAALGLLAIVVVYQLFFSGGPAKPRPRAQNNNSPSPATAQRPAAPPRTSQKTLSSADQQAEMYRQLIADTTPLNLSLARSGGEGAKIGERGNIFAYYVPPPKPPDPPPPPPPITLQAIQPQSAIATTPRSFALTVMGQGFPADAQIILEGRPKPTKRVGDTQLSTEVSQGEYSGPKTMTVEVKSQSDPAKIFSNQLSFTVQAAPVPPFKYIGRIGEKGLFEMPDKTVQRLARGSTIGGVWRIEAISDAGVDLTQTQYDIKKRIPMQEKGR